MAMERSMLDVSVAQNGSEVAQDTRRDLTSQDTWKMGDGCKEP